MIIDAHHHLWTADYQWLAAPGLEAIRRDYAIADLVPQLDEAGVTATVLVEAGRCDAEETAEFLAHAATTPRIAGVVGWASLTDPAIAATLAGYRELPGATKLVGLRDQVQGVADPGHLTRSDVRAALAAIGPAGLTFDLVVHVGQLTSCAEAARATPGTTFVLDHLGKPRIAAAGLVEWRTAVRDLAGCDNVVAKLSGPHRLMAGSDWPVCDLVASYAEAWTAIDASLGELSATERADVLAGTAIRTYALEVGS
ncbi:amidohydrolase family protein [Micromonospora saelicesensis]|uniref:L-fuconolactonase n=1 Tax=Micromonospora saelicesensis TaxID=285676 RepID=A0A1C4WJG0_9ACTN|nr:amidohydrolase family protein [Micromonospora saelicesensis]SCE96340.1 L-fuconolactonase [Micromonospora saelicesensis]